jgi:lysophospholipase L1-like esterase
VPGRRSVAEPRGPGWRRRIAALGIGVALALLVAEVVLRLAGIESPPRLRYDPSLGLARRPGMCWVQRDEGRARVCINPDGVRDAAHSIVKPPGVVRIAVLGDSYTEALQVEEDERFTSRLEEMLNSRGGLQGRRVEVLNFGVSGYGTCQELLLLDTTVLRYSPDVVLLQFMTGNDVLDNTRVLSGDPMRPYFCVVDGRLRECRPSGLPWDGLERLLKRGTLQALRYSRVAQVAARGGTVLRERAYRRKLERMSRQGHEDAAQDVGLSSRPYEAAPGPEVEQAWEVTCAVIDSLHGRCEEAGVQFGVILAGASIEVHPDVAIRDAYCRRNGIDGFENPERQIRRRTRHPDMEVLALNRVMADSALASGRYFHGFPPSAMGRGHWNPEGHRCAARCIADWIPRLSPTG